MQRAITLAHALKAARSEMTVPQKPRKNRRIDLVLITLGAVALGLFTSLAVEQWRRAPDVWNPVIKPQREVRASTPLGLPFQTDTKAAQAAMAALSRVDNVADAVAESSTRWQLRPWMAIHFGLDAIPVGVVGALTVLMPQGDRTGLLALIASAGACVLLFVWSEQIQRAISAFKRLSARFARGP